MSLPDAKDFIEKASRFDRLVKTVFSSGPGKELLKDFKDMYVDSKLFQDNDRDTVYCIAQRDLIMELVHKVKMGNEQ